MTARLPRTALVAALALVPACGSRRATTTPGAAAGDAVRDAGDAGPNFRVPAMLPAPGAPSPNGREVDARLGWLFLPEDPVPTGSAPDVLVGARLPCDFRPVYGSVSRPVSPLGVRLRAQYTREGRPDPGAPCPRPALAVEYVSLQRLRLGVFEVTDATPRDGGAAPRATLRVVPDDATLPPRQVRRVRRCTPGDDATCTAGGVCGAVPGRDGVGVCAPPLDLYLNAGRACPPATAEVALAHPGPYAVEPAPPPGVLRACLPACDAQRPCDAPLACATLDGRGVCVPR